MHFYIFSVICFFHLIFTPLSFSLSTFITYIHLILTLCLKLKTTLGLFHTFHTQFNANYSVLVTEILLINDQYLYLLM